MTRIEKKLKTAIQSNDLYTLKKLLYHHFSIHDHIGNGGMTPLLIAVDKNNQPMVTYLISLGADINQPSCLPAEKKGSGYIDGITPLMLAARNNYVDILKYLLDKPEIKLYEETTDRSRASAIFFAISGEHYEAFSELMNAGIDIHHIYSCGNPILVVPYAKRMHEKWLAEKEHSALISKIQSNQCHTEMENCLF